MISIFDIYESYHANVIIGKTQKRKKETENEAMVIMENTNLKTSLFKISGDEMVWLIVWKLLSSER